MVYLPDAKNVPNKRNSRDPFVLGAGLKIHKGALAITNCDGTVDFPNENWFYQAAEPAGWSPTTDIAAPGDYVLRAARAVCEEE